MNANSPTLNTATPKSYSAPVNNPLDNLPKAYGAGSPQTKQLGGDPALAQWYSEATAWYQAAISGQIEANPMDVQQVAQYLQWAAQQMGMGPQWDPTMGAGGLPGQSPEPQTTFYDYESNEIYMDGSEGTTVSFGTDETLIVPSMAAKVEYVWTTDDSIQPSRKILKVVVTNLTTGLQHVVKYENADRPDFKLVIKAADTDSVKGTAPNLDITTEKYDMENEKGDKAGKPPSSVTGEVNDNGDWEYVAEESNEVIHFNPQGTAEEPQTHIVWGDAAIHVPPGYTIDFTIQKDDQGRDIVVAEVRDRDGQLTDTYQSQYGFVTNAEVKEEYATFDGKSYTEDGMPEEFGDKVMINGDTSQTASGKAETALNNLMELFGVDSEQAILDALKSAGYEYNNVDDLTNAIKDGEFPPKVFDEKFANFLKNVDNKLSGLLDDLADYLDSDATYETQREAREAVDARLVELLQGLFPEEEVWAKSVINEDKGSIMVGDQKINWYLHMPSENFKFY